MAMSHQIEYSVMVIVMEFDGAVDRSVGAIRCLYASLSLLMHV